MSPPRQIAVRPTGTTPRVAVNTKVPAPAPSEAKRMHDRVSFVMDGVAGSLRSPLAHQPQRARVYVHSVDVLVKHHRCENSKEQQHERDEIQPDSQPPCASNKAEHRACVLILQNMELVEKNHSRSLLGADRRKSTQRFSQHHKNWGFAHGFYPLNLA